MRPRLGLAIGAASSLVQASKRELEDCYATFDKLIEKRNALIHAHPFKEADVSEILAFQGSSTKLFPNIKWPREAAFLVPHMLISADWLPTSENINALPRAAAALHPGPRDAV